MFRFDDDNALMFFKEVENQENTCPKCNFHMRIGAKRRIEFLADDSIFEVKEYVFIGSLMKAKFKKNLNSIKATIRHFGWFTLFIIPHFKNILQPRQSRTGNFFSPPPPAVARFFPPTGGR